MILGSILAGMRGLSLFQNVQFSSGAHPTSDALGIGEGVVLSVGVVGVHWLVHEGYTSPPSCAEINGWSYASYVYWIIYLDS
jgi:hypothetical protein